MFRTTSRRAVALALAAALVLVACGDDDSSDTSDSSSTTVAEASFPVTVTAENGEVEIAAQPERIVSLSPSLTEMLFAIEAGDQVVAVDKFSNFPAGTPVTEISGFRPNVEAIGGYEPDLVILSGDRDGIVGALGALSVPTLVLPSAETLEDVYDQIELLGDATGHPAEAAEVAEGIEADLAAIADEVPESDEPITYFYEVSDDLHTVTSDTFIGGLLGLVGLESIADGVDPAAGGFPQMTNEAVLAADPDFIFLADTDAAGFDPATVTSRPGWGELQAVQEGHLVSLPEDVASRWGPRIVDLLRAVVDAVAGTGT